MYEKRKAAALEIEKLTKVSISSCQRNLMKTYHNEANTGKSLSEALILGSTNPQYVKRLFIDLPVQYMKTTSSEHGENMCA